MIIEKIIMRIKRKKMVKKVVRTAAQVGDNLKVNGWTVVNSKTKLGNNVNFNGLSIIGNGPVTIGNQFHSGQGCFIITQNHDYDFGETIPYSASHSIEEPVVIEDNVWLGVGVIILPGVTIGEGAIIQAGSVVTKDIPPLGIAGGHPARVFKNRNAEHYYKLKKEGLYF